MRCSQRVARFLFAALMLSAISLGISCTTRPQKSWQAGDAVLRDVRVGAATHLEIAQADPQSGDWWSAVFDQEGRDPLQPDQGAWKISSASGDVTLQDRRADSGAIRHFLDNLATLRFVALAPKGPLESFGLARPRFAFRGTGPGSERFAISFGSATREGTFARVDDTVIVVEGGALSFLDLWSHFDSLRDRRFWGANPDDVDEIEIRDAGKKKTLVQREGAKWSEGKDWDAWLEEVSKVTVTSFVATGEPAAASRHDAILRGRSFATTLTLWPSKGGTVFGTSSDRPGAVFKLNSEAYSLFLSAGARRR